MTLGVRWAMKTKERKKERKKPAKRTDLTDFGGEGVRKKVK